MQRIITYKNVRPFSKSYSQEIDTRGQLRALLSQFKHKKFSSIDLIPRKQYLSHRPQIRQQKMNKIENSNKNLKLPTITPKRRQVKTDQMKSFQHHIFSNYLNFKIKTAVGGSELLRRKRSHKKLSKNKFKIRFGKEKQLRESSTIHEAQLQIIKNRQDLQSIQMKKEYSLKQSPMKHYTQQKMQRQRREWKQFDPLQLITHFADAASKLGSKMNQINENTFFKPKSQKLDIKLPSKNGLANFIKKYVPKNNEIKMIQLIQMPTFSIQYGQHSLYFGQSKQGVHQGMGIQIRNGSVFEGNWKDGIKVKGVQLNEHGKYNGFFKNNKKEGKGQFRWPNGQFYSGLWKDGKRHGVGMWTSQKGDSYMGQWKQGIVEGQGVHKFNNGQKYEGGFQNFLKHGFGKQYFPNGDRYEGEYLQGLPHGFGTYFWASGPIYQGNFVKGFRQGPGALKTDKGFHLKGQFKQQRAQGECEIDYGNGQVYKGNMKRGKRNGKGTLRNVAKRKIFEGYWKDNEFVTLQQSK